MPDMEKETVIAAVMLSFVSKDKWRRARR